MQERSAAAQHAAQEASSQRLSQALSRVQELSRTLDERSVQLVAARAEMQAARQEALTAKEELQQVRAGQLLQRLTLLGTDVNLHPN